ncbi:hypothetical protein C8F01DRAFT_1058155 [Mycena amicta]|nr:hypothetical protein C8F01DRAFT_1058155 [Mycena amicta]
MSNGPPPAKRKRPEFDSDDSPITRSIIWMPHGDVILAAESIHFRVNKDVLGQQSTVFQSMFSLPLPPDEPTVEGCAVVTVVDSATDWELLLQMLYDPFKYGDLWPFDLVAAMVRLGTKYEMTSVQTAAVERIQHEFPSSYTTWRELSSDFTKMVSKPGLALEILELAIECKIRTSIPALAFYCVDIYSLKSIIRDEVLDSNGTPIVPSVSTKMTLAVGVENVYRHQQTLYKWLMLDDIVPSTSCMSKDKCEAGKHSVSSRYLSTEGDFTTKLLLTWEKWWTKGLLCDPCSKAVHVSYEIECRQTWECLPGFFGLPQWNDLRDFE